MEDYTIIIERDGIDDEIDLNKPISFTLYHDDNVIDLDKKRIE